ncbi:unnamed protein product [Urochloa humidicola]
MAWGLLAARSPMAADVAADRGGHGGCPRRGAILLLDRTPTLQKLMSSQVQAQSSATRNRTYQTPHIRGSLPAAAAALRCTRCTQEGRMGSPARNTLFMLTHIIKSDVSAKFRMFRVQALLWLRVYTMDKNHYKLASKLSN